jgi:hypothetical protein
VGTAYSRRRKGLANCFACACWRRAGFSCLLPEGGTDEKDAGLAVQRAEARDVSGLLRTEAEPPKSK